MPTKQEKQKLRKIFGERLKQAIWNNFRHELEQKSINPSNDHGIQTFIGEKIGMSQQAVNNWFNEDKETLPRIELLPKISRGLNVPIDYLLGNEREVKAGSVDHTVVTAIQTILDHIESPAVLQGDTELISLPIFQFNGTGHETTDRLILQGEVSGRRKNIIPIRIDSEEKMNILLFTKRKGREVRTR